MPELPLENVLGGRRATHPRAARYFLRDLDREVGVAREQLEGLLPRGFGDELSAEVTRPDRVRLSDRCGSPVLVPAHRERESEGEDEADNAEERCLEDAERFSQLRLVLTEI